MKKRKTLKSYISKLKKLNKTQLKRLLLICVIVVLIIAIIIVGIIFIRNNKSGYESGSCSLIINDVNLAKAGVYNEKEFSRFFSKIEDKVKKASTDKKFGQCGLADAFACKPKIRIYIVPEIKSDPVVYDKEDISIFSKHTLDLIKNNREMLMNDIGSDLIMNVPETQKIFVEFIFEQNAISNDVIKNILSDLDGYKQGLEKKYNREFSFEKEGSLPYMPEITVELKRSKINDLREFMIDNYGTDLSPGAILSCTNKIDEL